MSKKQTNLSQKAMNCLLPMFLVVMFVFLLSRVFSFLLISPDDIGMKSIISGVFTGTPDGHCVFIRYPLAAALAFLYQLVPVLDWYNIFLLGCYVLCFFLVFRRFCRLHGAKSYAYLGLSLVVLAIMFTQNIINLEWTVTAGLLGATAIYRYCTIPELTSPWKRFCEYFICLLLLALGFCLRHTVVLMYIPLAFICWVKRLADANTQARYEKRKTYIWEISFLCTACLAVVGILIAHNFAYSSEDWKAYSEYTEDRSALFDYYGYPNYDTYQEEYEKAGISYETYILMCTDYNFAIPTDHFEEIDLHAIAELAKSIHTDQSLPQRLENCYNKFYSIVTDNDVSLIFVLLLILLSYNLFVVAKGNHGAYLYITAVIMWFCGICFYLLFKNRLPTRVALCCLFGIIAALSGNAFTYHANQIYIAPPSRDIKLWLSRSLMGLLVCVLLAGQTHQIYKENKGAVTLAVSNDYLATYCNEHSDNLYFYDFWSFSQRGSFFLSSVKSPNYVRSGGWMYNSPAYDEMLEQYDCYDLIDAIKKNQNIFYLVTTHRSEDVIARLNAYFESIGEPIVAVVTDSFNTTVEEAVVIWFQYAS